MSDTYQSQSLDALRTGDREEVARMVDAFSPKIYRLALKILGDPQDAEDVLQETFYKALRGLRNFEGRSSLSTWIYRIAVNEALMTARRRRPDSVSIEEREEAADNDEGLPLQIADWCCLPESELISAEARRHLDEAVTRLPERLRVVFVLRDVEGLSIKETAEALDLSEATVKVRLFRARLKLREDLSAYFGEQLSERSSK